MHTTRKRMERALKLLIDTIEATGGVVETETGNYAPVGDPDWIDLGDAYVAACQVIGRLPKVAEEDR